MAESLKVSMRLQLLMRLCKERIQVDAINTIDP